jgi:hypothetical protein
MATSLKSLQCLPECLDLRTLNFLPSLPLLWFTSHIRIGLDFGYLFIVTRESRVRPNRGSGGEPEHLHLIGVLSFDDEFREDVGCGGIQEKFRHALAQGIGHDQL